MIWITDYNNSIVYNERVEITERNFLYFIAPLTNERTYAAKFVIPKDKIKETRFDLKEMHFVFHMKEDIDFDEISVPITNQNY